MSEVLLDDVCEFYNGGAWSDKEYVLKGIPVLKVTNCKSTGFQIDDINYLPKEAAEKYKKNRLELNDVIIATVGSHPNLVESAAGRAYIVNGLVEGFYLNQNAVCLRTKDSNVLDQKYLGYLCMGYMFRHYIQNKGRGAANQMRIAIGAIKGYKFELPDIEVQRKVANILSNYDNMIENHQKQIKLLEEAAQRIYKEWFIDFGFLDNENSNKNKELPDGWKKNRADAFFDITIGKTPPRSEKQWFVSGKEGIKWISISDMGKSGVFIFNTSEGLTEEAVVKHNIKVIPKGTILVSFKLTVGRVSITTENMCTNEAIAHFYIENDYLREYTYLYLKMFEYDTLGNTSSISKAVNSKIIKGMSFIMPDTETLQSFSNIVRPFFDLIYDKQQMIIKAQEARNRLLPKLINGEIEV